MKLLHYVEQDGEGEYVVLLDDEDYNDKQITGWCEPGYISKSINDVGGSSDFYLPTECILRKE